MWVQIFLVGEIVDQEICEEYSGAKSEGTLLAFSSTGCVVLKKLLYLCLKLLHCSPQVVMDVAMLKRGEF